MDLSFFQGDECKDNSIKIRLTLTIEINRLLCPLIFVTVIVLRIFNAEILYNGVH